MTPDEVSAVLAEHEGDHVCHEFWHEAGRDGECETHRLASLVSEQAAALARVEALIFAYSQSPFRDMSHPLGATSDEFRTALAGEQS